MSRADSTTLKTLDYFVNHDPAHFPYDLSDKQDNSGY